MAGSALPFGELTLSPSAGTGTFPVSPFLLLPPSVLFSSPLYLPWPLCWPSVPPMALFLTLPSPGDKPGLLEELGTTPAPRMLHRAEEHCTRVPAQGARDRQMDRWMLRYSIPKSLCPAAAEAVEGLVLWQALYQPILAIVWEGGRHWFIYSQSLKYPQPSLLWGQRCPAESALPGCALYPEGAGPPPALQLFPANREACASFQQHEESHRG